MTDYKQDIALLNSFKTYKEADAHRLKLKDPDSFGILTLVKHSLTSEDCSEMNAVVSKRILKTFLENDDAPRLIEMPQGKYLPNDIYMKTLIKRYADGKKPCNCGVAYYDDEDRCRSGCSANQITATEYVCKRAIEEINSLIKSDNAPRLSQPIPNEQLRAMYHKLISDTQIPFITWSEYSKLVRNIEKAHGIGETK